MHDKKHQVNRNRKAVVWEHGTSDRLDGLGIIRSEMLTRQARLSLFDESAAKHCIGITPDYNALRS